MKGRKTMVYYIEDVSPTVKNIFEVELSQRHTIWASHPTAREISRKEYLMIVNAANEQMEKDKLDKAVIIHGVEKAEYDAEKVDNLNDEPKQFAE